MILRIGGLRQGGSIMDRKKLKKLYLLFETNGYRIIEMEGKNKFCKGIFCPYRFLDIGGNFDKQISYEIGKNIKSSIENLKDIESVTFVCQGLGEICKEIDVPVKAKRREILEIINFEMQQFYNIYTEDYKISYKDKNLGLDKKIGRDLDELDHQIKKINITLFPKALIKFMKDIAEFIGLKIDEIILDLDLIGAYIGGISANEDKYSILEARERDIVLAVVENLNIVKSLVITEEIDDNLLRFLEENGCIKLIGDIQNHLIGNLKNLKISDVTDTSVQDLLEIYVSKKDVNRKKFLSDLIFINKYKNTSIYRGDKEVLPYQAIAINIIFIALFIVLLTSFLNYNRLQTSLSELDNIEKNKLIKTSKDDIYSGKSKENIYGVDFEKLESIISILGDRIISLNSSKDETEIEFRVDSKKELDTIVSNKEFKSAVLVSVYEKEDKLQIEERVEVEEKEKPEEKQNPENADGENKEENEKTLKKEKTVKREKTIKKEKLINYIYVKGKFK